MEQGGPSDRLKHFYEEVRDARRTLHPLAFATKACGPPAKSLSPEAAAAILEAAGTWSRACGWFACPPPPPPVSVHVSSALSPPTDSLPCYIDTRATQFVPSTLFVCVVH